VSRPILLLRLEAPLQSWGARSRWDVRDTEPEPTKSGVIGLLGCALGYGIGDARLETELDAGLVFGVRVEHAGRVGRDYQTVSGFLPTADGRFRHTGVRTATSLEKLRGDPDVIPATIESPRFYLEDASFLVALASANADEGGRALLARCAAALKDPVWPLYLGRKACVPTRPIFEALTSEYADLEDALRRHPWSWLHAEGRPRSGPGGPLAAYVEDAGGPLQRQDAIRVNVSRQYGFRRAREVRCDPSSDETR
jgi:CRISPR system Cascade subunit CasD